MAVWVIVLLVVVGLVVLMFVGGLVANARVRAARERERARHVEEADHALARARAEDRGWERAGLEAAARAAFDARRPGAQVISLDLVQVIDRPGTEEDRAAFAVVTPDGEERIELVRSGDSWSAAS